ncbi:hypothetical protein ACHWQZ_G012403 [Mnemiopsis leidyi]
MELESLVSLGARTRALNEELDRNINDLRNELKEIGYGKSKNLSSVAHPQDTEDAEVERLESIKRILSVPDMRPLDSHDKILASELRTCDTSEHSPDSIPFILHQFFLTQCEDLLLLKKMHLSRWSRFCRHGVAVTDLHQVFQDRVREIMEQYKDFWHRAHRLEPAHRAFLGGKPAPIHLVTNEDMCLYLNWMCWKFSSTEKINNFIMVLSHIIALHKSRIEIPEALDDDTTAFKWEKWLNDPARDEKFYSSGWRKRDKLNKLPESSQSRINSRFNKQSSSSSTEPQESKAMINARVVAAEACFEAGREDYGMPVASARLETYKHRLQNLLDSYAISIDLDNLSPADELELYYQAHRRLKNILSKQTQMMRFPVSGSLSEDEIDPTLVINTFLKPSTWEPHRQLYPQLDATRQAAISHIKQRNTMDELLKSSAAFLANDSLQDVSKSLKNYVSNLREMPGGVRPHSVASHPAGKDTQAMWKRIHLGDSQNDEMEDKDSISDVNGEDDGVLGALSGRGPQANGVHGAFSFTPGNLGFGHTGKTSSGKDAHMAYLMLRHLKLRHIRRSCLGIINYFKSVERTINLDLVGSWDKKKDGDIGRLDSSFLHNTRIEHIQKMYEYFESGDIENVDDFYMEDEGITHAQDSSGFFVMYQSALDTLRELEEELLLVCTHYISKDRDNRLSDEDSQNPLPRRNSAFTTSKLLKQPPLVVDLVAYSHVQIDRTAVLLDIWSQEIAFQKNKKKLIDCYMEIYNHVWSLEEKRKLAQVMVSIMYRRPRYDVEAPYFIRTYINECQILAQWTTLTQEMANMTFDTERSFGESISQSELNGLTGGLPFQLIKKQPISVTHANSVLQTSYFLEFCNGLSKVADVPAAIDHALQELVFAKQPRTTGQLLSLHRQLLEACKVEWVKLDTWGNSYSPSVHQQVLSSHVTHSPAHLHVIASQHEKNMVAQLSTQSRHPSRSAIHTQRVSAWGTVMEMLLIKERLQQTVIETDLLIKLYKSQARDLGFEQHHAHIRPVAFESGTTSEAKTTFSGDDDVALDRERLLACADRYVPSNNILALQELDEKDLGTIVFHTKDSIIKMLILHGLCNVRLALKTQLVQRNNLVIAVKHNDLCSPISGKSPAPGSSRPTSSKAIKTSDYFLSLQLAQNVIRDNMVKDFVRASVKIGREREKVIAQKQESVGQYCENLHDVMSVFSLRVQINRYVKSLKVALSKFPEIRDTHFKIGQLGEERTPEDEKPFLPVDKNYFKSRPRKLLSNDGLQVINSFYIPHQFEVLGMFNDLEPPERRNALQTVLGIVSGMHDMVSYMVAYVNMGASKAKLGSNLPSNVSVGADWGGPEAISHELTEIQLQLSHLSNPTDPQEILEYFECKRKVFFLEFYFTISHCIPDTFLAKGNEKAFFEVSGSLEQTVRDVSDLPQRCLRSLLPHTRGDMYSHQAATILPYRSFAAKHGPFVTSQWQCERTSALLTIGLSQLNEFNRDVANGEVVGVSLLLEDVLHQGRAKQDKHLAVNPLVEPSQHYSNIVNPFSKLKSPKLRLTGSASASSSRVQSAVGSVVAGEDIDISFLNDNYMSLVDNEPVVQDQISYLKDPISALQFLHEFLLMSVRVKQLKTDWCCRYLNLPRVSESKQYHIVELAYLQQVLEPSLNLLTHVIRTKGFSEEGVRDMSPDRKLGLLTEYDARESQLAVLLENLESFMIRETSNRILRDLTLIKAEKLREDGSLPLDLWKTQSAKDTISLPRSDIIQHFANQLLHKAQLNETNQTFTIDKEWVEKCLNELGSTFMQHEKLNFQTYSSFYENLLRHKEQTILLKEREVTQSEQELALCRSMTDTSLQTILAERVDDLIIELTALRAKISEMREEHTFLEGNMRSKLRMEYNELVHNMFSTCDTLRHRFDEFREQLVQECRENIKNVKMSAIDKMRVVRRQTINGTENRLEEYASHAKTLGDLEEENSDLNKLLYKLRTISTWKKTGMRTYYSKKEGALRDQLVKSEREKLELQLKHEQDLVNLRQDNEAKKTAALSTEREIKALKKQLEDKKKESERKIELLNKEIDNLRVEARKPANYDVIISELASKEEKLRLLESEQIYNDRIHDQESSKREKLIKKINYQLNKATSLKKEAFTRVEELQDQLNEYESVVMSPTPTPFTPRPNTTLGNRVRRLNTASSDNKRLSRPKSTGLLVKRSVIHGGQM